MFLYAYSLEDLKSLLSGHLLNAPVIVISIQSTFHNLTLLPVHSNCIDILYMRFDDIGYGEKNKLGKISEIPINSSHADQIIEFVDKYKDQVNDIVFSCNAGMSRSVGTMLAFHRIINNDRGTERLLYHKYNLEFANQMVFDTIMTRYKNIK